MTYQEDVEDAERAARDALESLGLLWVKDRRNLGNRIIEAVEKILTDIPGEHE